MVTMPAFTAHRTIYRTRASYQARTRARSATAGGAVHLQQFAACEDQTWCIPPTMWCRTHCCRWDHSTFRSLWFICGICGPFPWFDDAPDPCIPVW
jgi:hypothetical protein